MKVSEVVEILSMLNPLKHTTKELRNYLESLLDSTQLRSVVVTKPLNPCPFCRARRSRRKQNKRFLWRRCCVCWWPFNIERKGDKA